METKSGAGYRVCCLKDVLFSMNLNGIDIELLKFCEQIEQGHTFILALLNDNIERCVLRRQASQNKPLKTPRILCITTTSLAPGAPYSV